MKNHNASIIVFAGCALAALHLALPARATLLAYEGFDYPAGANLVGQTGGFGFSTAWGSSAGIQRIDHPGLSYPGLITSGGHLYLEGTSAGNALLFRDLTVGHGTEGTTVWISFMHQRTGPVGGDAGPGGNPSYLRPINLALFEGGSERLALGEGTRSVGTASAPDTDVWGLVVSGNVNIAATTWTTASLAVESLALVRIDYGPGDVDTAYMWINPSLGAEPDIASAMAAANGNFAFNRIRPFAGNPSAAAGNLGGQGTMDEIRIGTTWASVVPEPSTMALFTLGLGSLLLARARRRQV